MKQPNISVEFYPPKTEQSQASLVNSMEKLAAINPNFVSVTYGAGGSTREGTILTLSMLQQHTVVPVAPHLSCIGSSRTELMDVLLTYKALGVRRIVALRGDLPSGMGQSGDLRYASELVSLIRDTTQNYFHIEVAAYPETHPQAKCAQSDIQNLKRKIGAGADSAITQYFYNPDAYFYFLDACAREGISAPVIPGIMPILSFSRLQRFSEVCGAEIPQWMRKRFEAYGDDVESIKAFGIEVVYGLCERLLKGGAPGLHFYTLNQAEPTCAIVNMLKPTKKLSVVTEEQKYVSEPV
jgi:methylenetetrahydrofolate reductase (NADPH)